MLNNLKKFVFTVLALMLPMLALAHPAQDVIEQSTKELMEILKTDKQRLSDDATYLEQVVDEKIVPHVDLNAMTALSLGKNWRAASADQKTELVSEFKELLMNTYMSALTLYTGQEMEFKPFVPQDRDDRAVVRAVFLQPGTKGVPVNYKLREKDGSWLVYDIDVNSINLVSTYRSAFSQSVAKSGIDGLIAEMKQRNQEAEASRAN